MHEWLEYTYQLLGRSVNSPETPRETVTGTPISVAPPASEDLAPSKNSIAGVRPSSLGTSSTTFGVDLPADGRYSIELDCWWPRTGGNLLVLVDESTTASDGYGLRASGKTPLRTWTKLRPSQTVLLGKGSHTIRIFAPTPEVRIGQVRVLPADR
jgi:hypothetical protein